MIVKKDRAGNLVTSFGDAGIFRYNVTAGVDEGSLSLDSSGDNNEGFVFRVTSDGQFDPHFGTIMRPPNDLNDVAVDAANRVVVVGTKTAGTLDVAVARINPNVEFADSFENGQLYGENGHGECSRNDRCQTQLPFAFNRRTKRRLIEISNIKYRYFVR